MLQSLVAFVTGGPLDRSLRGHPGSVDSTRFASMGDHCSELKTFAPIEPARVISGKDLHAYPQYDWEASLFTSSQHGSTGSNDGLRLIACKANNFRNISRPSQRLRCHLHGWRSRACSPREIHATSCPGTNRAILGDRRHITSAVPRCLYLVMFGTDLFYFAWSILFYTVFPSPWLVLGFSLRCWRWDRSLLPLSSQRRCKG